MSYKVELNNYHFKSYKNGEFAPTPTLFEKGDLSITFEYDGTNDIYIIPKHIVDTYREDDELFLNDLINDFECEYKYYIDELRSSDIGIEHITVKNCII